MGICSGGRHIRIITPYTKDTPYQKLAHECRDAFDSIGVEIDLIPYHDRGSWEKNTLQKPKIIKKEISKEPLICIDSDVRPSKEVPGDSVKKFFTQIGWILTSTAGVVVEKRHDQPIYQKYSTGIIGISPCAKSLINMWITYQNNHKKEFPDSPLVEQEAFARAIQRAEKIRVFELFDGTNYRETEPVKSPITHIPASRKYR